jgi:hypothetical protein
MKNILGTMGIELIPVHNPGYRIHIDGAFVMVDVDTAIINMNELPYVFIDYLKSRKMKLISVPPEDNAFSVNCLAVAPGRVIMHTSVSPRLADKLDKSGITVLPVDYDCVELGGGGSTARRRRSRAIRSDFARGRTSAQSADSVIGARIIIAMMAAPAKPIPAPISNVMKKEPVRSSTRPVTRGESVAPMKPALLKMVVTEAT